MNCFMVVSLIELLVCYLDFWHFDLIMLLQELQMQQNVFASLAYTHRLGPVCIQRENVCQKLVKVNCGIYIACIHWCLMINFSILSMFYCFLKKYQLRIVFSSNLHFAVVLIMHANPMYSCWQLESISN
jgi:hypothetical protein